MKNRNMSNDEAWIDDILNEVKRRETTSRWIRPETDERDIRRVRNLAKARKAEEEE